jgi:hypothetical protein
MKLRKLVQEQGPNAWRTIAQSMPGRNSRQCRERWLNYLNPARNTQPWTETEDQLLQETYASIGPRWVYMMKLFPRRTDGMIKNRFMALQRKNQRIASPIQQLSSAEESDFIPMLEDPFDEFSFEPFTF